MPADSAQLDGLADCLDATHVATAVENEHASLVARLKNLPQELQDEILGHTVGITPGKAIINKQYRPPIAFQINRKLRETMAKTYYRECIEFEIEANYGFKQCYEWLRSLTPQRRAMIGAVTFPIPGIFSGQPGSTRVIAQRWARMVRAMLESQGVALRIGAVTVAHDSKDEKGHFVVGWVFY